jgi:hypothetical protein
LGFIKGFLWSGLFLLLIVCARQAYGQSLKEDPSLYPEKGIVEPVYHKVRIADPFIELHTGPGAGYPIYYVVDRGAEVEVMRRKTDWFKIRTADGKTGWASREQMRQTLLPTGEQFQVVELDQEDFTARRWVLGVTGGEFASAPVFTVFTAYSFTENLAAELHFGQSVGRKSSSTFLKTNLVMQPLPDLKYSPYMTLGMGEIRVDPSATLISPVEDTNTFAQFGIGIQRYISRSFLARLEVNEYIIFAADSTRNDNEDVNEWKFGFAVFF